MFDKIYSLFVQTLLINLFVTLLCSRPLRANDADDGSIMCEDINVPMCKGIGWNVTALPNQFDHQKQEDVAISLASFRPLIETKCSDDLLVFLCSVHTPICLEDGEDSIKVPPCRSVCIRARRGCSSVFAKFDVKWPESMDCKNYPNYGSENICADYKEGSTQPSSSSSSNLLPHTPSQDSPVEPTTLATVRSKSKEGDKINKGTEEEQEQKFTTSK